jgi:hypothetical protein
MNILNEIAKAVTGKPRAQAETPVVPPAPASRLPGAVIAGTGDGFHVPLPAAPKAPPKPKPAWESICQALAAAIWQPSETDLKPLRDVENRYQATWKDFTENFTQDKAPAELVKRQNAIWKRLYDENRAPRQDEYVTLQTVKMEFEARHESARGVLAKLNDEALRLAAPIRATFIAKATEHLNDMEAAETAEADLFGESVAYGPRVRALRALLNQLKSAQSRGQAARATQLLPFVKF